jgi:hypothetical protein
MHARLGVWFHCIFACAIVVCCLTVRTVRAEPSPAERETARSLMDEADMLREKGELWRALERYQAADQLVHVPTTGIEVARTQALLKRFVEACATAIEVANSAGSPNEPALFAQARRDAQAIVEDLRPRIPSLTVYVEPIGLAYELSLDGALVPEAARGLPYKLDPGPHALLVQAPGYRPVTEHVVLGEAQRMELRVRLVPNPPPPKLAVQPVTEPNPRTERERRVIARLDAANAAGRMRGYVALGLGGAVLATGIATGIVAVVETDQAKQRCIGERCPASVQPDLERANVIANVANVTLPLGVLGVAYGLFELLTHSGADVEYVRRAQPAVALTGSGVVVRGAL